MIVIISLILTMMVNSIVLFDFSENSNLENWVVVNDDVMGGRSQASLELNKEGNAIFKGRVSLENNGGFSSVRYNMEPTETKGYNTLAVHLKGDGKNYQVRIREKQSDYFSYITTFETSGDWETIEVPLSEMYPSFRGRRLNQENYSGKTIVELTFLIANKKAESFTLELKKAYLK